MNYKVIALLVVCIALVAAAGCAGLPGPVTQGSSSAESPRAMPYDSGSGITQGKVAWAGNAVSPAIAPVPTPGSYGNGGAGIETKIIKTADLTLEVSDVAGAVESLRALATAQGGYLSSTSMQKNYNNQLSGTVTIRVPQASFDAAIAGAKALGTVKSIATNGQDVTEEYVDLQAQKTSYTNQLAQYNAIMKQSTKVEDIIAVQAQIDRVQTELDRLNGRLNYLNNRIDISTITVYLQEPAPVGGQAGHNFVTTINEGIDGFFGMIDTLIILLFTLLPVIILGALGYGVYRWRKGRSPAPAVTPEEKK